MPLVAVDLENGETTIDLAPVVPFSGYRLLLAPLFRRVALGEENIENLARGWCMTEEARVAAEARVADGRRALGALRKVAAELELRDYAGSLVPTDWIYLTNLNPARPDLVTAFIQLRESHATIPAIERPTPSAAAGAIAPAMNAVCTEQRTASD